MPDFMPELLGILSRNMMFLYLCAVLCLTYLFVLGIISLVVLGRYLKRKQVFAAVDNLTAQGVPFEQIQDYLRQTHILGRNHRKHHCHSKKKKADGSTRTAVEPSAESTTPTLPVTPVE